MIPDKNCSYCKKKITNSDNLIINDNVILCSYCYSYGKVNSKGDFLVKAQIVRSNSVCHKCDGDLPLGDWSEYGTKILGYNKDGKIYCGKCFNNFPKKTLCLICGELFRSKNLFFKHYRSSHTVET